MRSPKAGCAVNLPPGCSKATPAALRSLRNDENAKPTRRNFCNRVLLTSAGVIVAAKTLNAQFEPLQDSLVAYPPMKIEGAERLMPGSAIYFCYPTRHDPAILLRDASGEYCAFNRKCSHIGCSVEFDPTRRCLECPCHKGTYDVRTGLVLYGPPPRPLDQIVLQVRAGSEVWAVGKSIGRSNEVLARSST
ncbi:MAG TPA: Rieske 2Fe-2S domain-containing protein [Pyrinomonadaceae bacterium]|nr:Rieske 2Fe-2S domain-containing protein [Pyrinomonadaceae bacterium]